MKETWKEELKNIKQCGMECGFTHAICPDLTKDFISKEIIEKIIDDIPDAEIDEYSGDSVSLLELKQQLKDKWLI